ncbi:uncharacterized protein si:dkey-75a21.2 [Centropristis striata]|uniref:uncharacterized protein si:dkey-75a21.2 n=1 Tax=Centropristis striata TaxID=184440 RepID=UPI0027DEF740|nr:uncharacterized protein si:dkey-75a21.2 [Centropristis striata]
MWCKSCNKETEPEQSLALLEQLLPEQYSHTVCSYVTLGETHFRASIKLKLSSVEDAKGWFEDFQSSSGFTWRISKTYPNGGRYNKYRMDYRCQHKTFGYVCKKRSKNTDCPATLFVILKRRPESGERKSRSGDPHMRDGLVFHVNLRHEHNHPTSCAKSVTKRDVSGETVEKLTKLFESGHSPLTAFETLKYDVQEEVRDNYVCAAGDSSACPDLQFCHRLYHKLFKKAFVAAEQEEMLKDLEQTLDGYNKEQGDVCARIGKTTDHQLVIAMCTPVMRRVHSRLRESSEMVFVDSSGHCDCHNKTKEKQTHRLFLLLAPSSAGGLPLGVFITTSESQATISAALELLQTVFPQDRFFGYPDGPLVVMSDDCPALRQALQGAFPEATLVLSVFHLLQAMWRWLWSSSNGVPKQHRAPLLKSFRGLVYASTPTALMKRYNSLLGHHVASQNPKFVRHLQEVFMRREEWAMCLRVQQPISGDHTNTNSYMESVMRVVKEKILHRLKAFNVKQLLDFAVTRMDSHYVRRLTDAANSTLHTSPQRLLETEDIGKYSIAQEDQDNYTLASLSNAAVSYHVNMALGCCTCSVGLHGRQCKHQSVVAGTFEHKDSFFLWVPPDIRKLFYQIATGKDIPDDWFETLMQDKPPPSEGAAAEIYFDPETDSDADSFTEPMESSPIPSSTSVETDSGESLIKDRLNSVFLDMTKKLDNPDFNHSITSFVKNYENIKTDQCAMVSALSSFGKSLQKKSRGCKRTMEVEPTGLS